MPMNEIWTTAAAMDLGALNWVNHDLGRTWVDPFWVLVTTVRTYALPGLSGVAFLLARCGRRGRAAVVAIALSILAADAVSSRIVKPLFGRIRPCNAVADLRLPDGRRGTLSFPSGHATNSAAIATVVSCAFPPMLPYSAAVALMVGFSRVYLGLHYPSDVLGGYLLGVTIGLLSWWAVSRWFAASAKESDPRLGEQL